MIPSDPSIYTEHHTLGFQVTLIFGHKKQNFKGEPPHLAFFAQSVTLYWMDGPHSPKSVKECPTVHHWPRQALAQPCLSCVEPGPGSALPWHCSFLHCNCRIWLLVRIISCWTSFCIERAWLFLSWAGAILPCPELMCNAWSVVWLLRCPEVVDHATVTHHVGEPICLSVPWVFPPYVYYLCLCWYFSFFLITK